MHTTLSNPQKQAHAVAHGRNVGTHVDDVGKRHQRHKCIGKPWRLMPPDVGDHALPGHAPQAGADELDGNHQGQRQQQRPQHAGTHLRAGLRIGGDPARIVICGAGDQAAPAGGTTGRRLRQARCAQLRLSVGEAPGSGRRGRAACRG